MFCMKRFFKLLLSNKCGTYHCVIKVNNLKKKMVMNNESNQSFSFFVGYGVMADGTTTYVNASVCTVNYQPLNPPIVIDLPTPRNT